MRSESHDWLFRVFKLLVIIALLVMLTQPETCAFAMSFLDASMLDVFVLLFQAQLLVMLALFFRCALKPALAWIKNRTREFGRSRAGRRTVAIVRTGISEWSGPLGATLWLWWVGGRSARGHSIRQA